MHTEDQRFVETQHPVLAKFYRELPHRELEEGTFFLTWRLDDALPGAALAGLSLESSQLRHHLLYAEPDPERNRKTLRRFEQRYDRWLDQGHGDCWLEKPEIAGTVIEFLRFHDRKLYRLAASAVMPNHVHAIVRLIGTASLERVMELLRSSTARESNRLLDRHGPFWSDDYYDRILRSDGELLDAIGILTRHHPRGQVEINEGEIARCRVLLT